MHINLIAYQSMLKMVSYKFKIKSDSSRIDNLTPNITVYITPPCIDVHLHDCMLLIIIIMSG